MSPKKTLVLGTLLLVPVLVFLFLKMFGVNTFSLRTYFPAKVISTMKDGQMKADTIFYQVPAFQLTSQTGASFSHKNLQDKIYVAHFFDASCQGICKQVSTQLTRVQDAFYAYPEVMIISFSLQPEKDQVKDIEQYAKSFRANPAHWVFLTGSPAFIQSFSPLDSTSAAGKGPDARLDQLYLIDKNRHIRGIYDGAKADEVDRLITEMNVLLNEYKK
ncbi:SCO family protein [Nibribacter ruber]|uniref:SCO family protein n=1 Tax=Nibribacter ruber TaxID=2698458 RepID=A0A6P1P0X2_9BACT|nr:SCO family protein [Nibribacter ruber]QHL87093.1 SCO family protein [Nibribacter ruber]